MSLRRSGGAVAQRGAPILLGGAALALGLVAEAHAFSWSDTRYWLPDLVTGLAVLACAAAAWPRARSTSLLLAATGATWFLGNFAPDLLYLHRGPLVHLLLTFPGWRSRKRWVQVSVAAAYLAAVMPVWRSELASVVCAGVVIALVSIQAWTASAVQRRDRDRALATAAVLAAAVSGGAVARLAVPSGALVDPTLLLYQCALVAAAALLASGSRRREQSHVDLVVELGGANPSGLREALTEVLMDRTLEVGYRTPHGDYVGDDGRPVGLVGLGRSATYVERGGEPVAVLVHDDAVLRHPELVQAASEATRLATAHAQLRAELQAQLVDLEDSRRRLVNADDAGRQEMRDRLMAGPGRRLGRLRSVLERAVVRHPAIEHLGRADLHVRQAIAELEQLAAGLHSMELANGLAPALTSLAARSPVDVELRAGVGRLDPLVEQVAYFFCAEALGNVVKHAGTDLAAVTADAYDGRLVLTVTDRGIGGADPGGGGLLGLADRLGSVGGTLHVTSRLGAGTQLTADIPVGRQPV